MRRSLCSLSFSSASLQTKGQVGNRDSTLLNRGALSSGVSSIPLDYNDVMGGGGAAHGQLINRARMARVSDQLIGNLNTGVRSSAPQIGMNSLAFQVSLLENGLLYEKAGSKINAGANTIRGLVNETAINNSTVLGASEKSSRGKYDDFLPLLMDSRKPNVELSETEMMKLRRHQRLLRTELHARAQTFLESAFSVGVPRQNVKSGKRLGKGEGKASSLPSSSSSSYIAGSNLGPLARFFNLFRLTRLAFTLEGEIVFTPEGGMEWLSLAETQKLQLDISRKELFSDPSRHVFISSEEKYRANKLYCQLAGAKGTNSQQQNLRLSDDSNNSNVDQNNDKKDNIFKTIEDRKVVTAASLSDEPQGSSMASNNADTENNNSSSLVPPNIGDDFKSSDIAAVSSVVLCNDSGESNGKLVNPKLSRAARGTLQILSPQLQRTNLTEDMQNIMVLALNAVEVELRAIDRELQAMLAVEEEAFFLAISKEVIEKEGDGLLAAIKDSSAKAFVPSAAFNRRASRLLAEVDEAMRVIAESIFMCGRGTRAVDELLDEVEEIVENASSTAAGTKAREEEHRCGDLADKEQTKANRKTALRRPLLLRKLVEARQQFFAPQEEAK